MGNALLIRPLPLFGLQLEWHGESEVLVTDGKNIVSRINTGVKGIRHATSMMQVIVETMHRDAVAMCV